MTESQSPQTVPAFLLKIQEILQCTEFAHIIRWDKAGECIHVVCVHALEEVVLPQYFRHGRYTSFVRQLNMYGFSKRKAEKNIGAAFYNMHFSKDSINFSAMAKRGKKQNKGQIEKEHPSVISQKQCQILQHQHDSSTEVCESNLKISAYNKQIPTKKLEMEQAFPCHPLPQIYELIAELAERIQPLLHDQIDWLNSRQLELLMRGPKFEKVSCAVLGFLDFQEISPFAEIHVNTIGSDRMEFIL